MAAEPWSDSTKGDSWLANLLRPQFRRLDPGIEQRLRRYMRRRPGRVRWGTLRRSEPFDGSGGWGRGVSIDRLLVERFIGRHASDLRGAVLEYGQASLAAKYGTQVKSIDVVGGPHNPMATIIADPSEIGALPGRHYDCCLAVEDTGRWTAPAQVLAGLWESLLPGGVLLVATPVVGPVQPTGPDGVGRWCATPEGLATLIKEVCSSGKAEVESFGSLVSSMAVLLGLAGADLRDGEMETDDPRYPVLAAARVMKEPEAVS